MKEIKFLEDTGGYAHRTRMNAAWADLTIAIAADLSTSGEALTRRSAGDKYLGFHFPNRNIPADHPSFAALASRYAAEAAEWIDENVYDSDGVKINIAGNGMRTLSKHGITQETTDAFLEFFFKALKDQLDELDIPIVAVRSGGQTGVDEAGIKAAHALGLSCTILAPRNFQMSPAGSEDVFGRESFIARFCEKTE